MRHVGKRVGSRVLGIDNAAGIGIAGNSAMSDDRALQLPKTFNRLAWSNLAAQSAEQVALAAAPIVAVIMLGVGEGQTGAAADRADAALHPVRHSRRSARRPHPRGAG